LLVAHAYVRYLGDLSGGQALRKVVGRGLGLSGSEGLSFYDFPGIADPDGFKSRFRESLDGMALAPELENRVVTEARDAFGLNVTLFEAVATQTPASGAPAPPHGA
jgi:heme oxygenase